MRWREGETEMETETANERQKERERERERVDGCRPEVTLPTLSHYFDLLSFSPDSVLSYVALSFAREQTWPTGLTY